MQKITFETKNGVIALSDADTGAVNGEWRRLWLNDFDGNSLGLDIDTAECLDLPGQRTLSAMPKARTITIKTGFAPLYQENGRTVSRGEKGRHELRREVLRLFPLGAEGTLTYANDNGKWHIDAYVSDTPKISYPAGVWAEAAVYLTADFPYWELSILESEEITVTEGSGQILSTRFGDIDSPIEIILTALTDIPASTSTLKIYTNNSGYWWGVNCEKDIPSGMALKYDVGTRGELMCYKRDGNAWVSAPEYWAFRGHEREVCNKTTATAFHISTPGSVKMKVIYHNLVEAI